MHSGGITVVRTHPKAYMDALCGTGFDALRRSWIHARQSDGYEPEMGGKSRTHGLDPIAKAPIVKTWQQLRGVQVKKKIT